MRAPGALAIAFLLVLGTACTPRGVGAGASVSATTARDDGLLACKTDTDCAVKDVGSCCGYRPACVRQDAKTFPEDVKARCAAEGRVGTCGFTAIAGCHCDAGRCAAIVEGLSPAAPVPLP
jgi:hypothetical protein